MQNIIKIYEHNKDLLEKFLISSINKFAKQNMNEKNIKEWFEVLDCLDAVYQSDSNYIQSTSLYTRHSQTSQRKGDALKAISELKDETLSHAITKPYISSATKKLIITIIVKNEYGYRFFDFNLYQLLSRFNLIPGHKKFTLFTKGSYLLMGATMLFFAIFSVFFGIGNFAYDLYVSHHFTLEMIFKPVIAVTLGLAFFDLGKTIILHEVFAGSEILEAFDAKSFVTFLTSIMIALFIETLLSLFKASLSSFSDILYVAALIIALSLLFFVFSYFVKNLGIWENKQNE